MVLITQACPNKSHRFQAISEGIFPAHDHTGKAFSADYYPKRFRKRGLPLAAGLAGCWAELRGDWKFLAQVLDLQEHYRKPRSLCHLCGACRNRPGLEFTDFAMNSPLRDSRISSDDWNAKYAVYGLPLILLPGFCIWHVYFDIMHTMDLGILQIVLASIMWTLTARPERDLFLAWGFNFMLKNIKTLRRQIDPGIQKKIRNSKNYEIVISPYVFESALSF